MNDVTCAPKQGSYLKFEKEILPNRETPLYHVSSTSGTLLGALKWYGPWRQFVFYPDEATLFNHECLKEIAQFCRERTLAYLHRPTVEDAPCD